MSSEPSWRAARSLSECCRRGGFTPRVWRRALLALAGATYEPVGERFHPGRTMPALRPCGLMDVLEPLRRGRTSPQREMGRTTDGRLDHGCNGPTSEAGRPRGRARKGAIMWWGIGFGGFFLYLVLVFTLGLMTLRNGHGVMFFLGIFFPILWIFGALMRPTAAAA